MQLSKLISVILHPIFIPIIALQTTLYLVPSIGFSISSDLNFIAIVIVLSTIVLPLISILFLIKRGLVKSLEMSDFTERTTPLLYTALFMFIGYKILDDVLTFTPILKAEFLGSIIIISLAGFISKFWKISLHLLGIGGLTGVLINLQILFGGVQQFIIVVILLSGVLGASRINEKAHNHAQIYVGFFLGFGVEMISLLIL